MTRRLQLVVIAIALTLAAGSAAWTATHPVKPNPVTPTPTVVASTTSPASAAPLPAAEVTPAAALAASTTVYPLSGEGWIHLTQRICGSSKNYLAIAAGRRLYAGQAVSVNCGSTAPAASTSTWTNPLPGTCRPAGGGGQFGAPRDDNGDGIADRYHQGIDLGSANTRLPGSNIYIGVPIHAVRAGTVSFAGWAGAKAGNQVQIRHAGGWVSKYNHLSSIAVHYGQAVTAGQKIGGMGATGNAQGAHLHVELWLNGVAKDPRQILPVRC